MANVSSNLMSDLCSVILQQFHISASKAQINPGELVSPEMVPTCEVKCGRKGLYAFSAMHWSFEFACFAMCGVAISVHTLEL